MRWSKREITMKHLKMLGLAAAAALSLMTFVGAGTASATTLCTNSNGTACYLLAGQKYGWSLKSGTTSKFTEEGRTIATCTASVLKAEAPVASAQWLSLDITELTWPAWPAVSCSTGIVTVHLGELTIGWISGNVAEADLSFTEFMMEAFGGTCTYGMGFASQIGVITGQTLIIAATVPKKSGGFLCASTTTWEAEYVITAPHAVFVVK